LVMPHEVIEPYDRSLKDEHPGSETMGTTHRESGDRSLSAPRSRRCRDARRERLSRTWVDLSSQPGQFACLLAAAREADRRTAFLVRRPGGRGPRASDRGDDRTGRWDAHP